MTRLFSIVAFACSLNVSSIAQADGVLVFGATGQLGAPHVRMLLEKGETVTAFVRPTSSRHRLQGMDGVRYAVGDLLDARSVTDAIKQTRPRVVIDTSARRGEQMTSGQDFYAQAMENIVNASRANRVKQIIIHSSVGVRGSAKNILKEQFGFDTESSNIRDKGQAEIYLENSGVGFTIIRNGLLEFEPVEPTGKGYLSQDMNSFGRITRTDLAALSVSCMDNPDCMGKIYHAADDSFVGMRPEREGGE